MGPLWHPRPVPRASFLCATLALLLLGAGPRGVSAQDSSLLAWVDAFVSRLTPHAESGVTVTVRGGRGIDDRKADVVWAPRLRAALEAAGVSPRGGLELEVTLSLEGDRVWAVGLIDGAAAPGPLAVVADWPVDRELEAVLGVRPPRAGQGRWSMERLGTLPSPVLDLALADLDGDEGDDVVVLGVDGLRTLLWSTLDRKPVAHAGPLPLPPEPAWGRVVEGWIAVEDGEARVATTAGHALRSPLGLLGWAPAEGVPLRQPPDPSRPPVLIARREQSVSLAVPGLDLAVRDAVRWPGRDDLWLWVGADGRLGARDGARDLEVPVGVVGDRFALADLDGDGRPELVTSGPGAPGEPDRIRIRAVGSDLSSLPVLFEGELSGSVSALAVGDVDFDGLGDLLFVEQTAGDPVLWRIRRRS